MIKPDNLSGFICFLLLLTGAVSCRQPAKSVQPNFIVFIADDISWDDFGCYGNQSVQTPNIDRMADGGLRFDQAFLTASSCSPSRISIMTGRYPHNTGAAELHTEPPYNFATIASKLKENGYFTGQAGKWHMGSKIKSGFEVIQEQRAINGDGGEDYWIPLLKSRDKDKPFFLWLASYDAHRVWGPNDFAGSHDPSALIPPPTLASGDSTRLDLASYYDEIKRFDFHIGAVEQELKQQGVLDNTVIIIMADNGRPFPRDKTRVYDSGMKTPFIVKWNRGVSNPGDVCRSLISAIDIAPTLLDISGIEIPASFQGKSFKSLLKSPQDEFREYVFAEHNWHDHEAHERMVRTEEYLYLLNSRPAFANQGPADAINSPAFRELVDLKGKGLLTAAQKDIFMAPRPAEELYDCRKDPLQLNNLAFDKAFDQTLNDLRRVLKDWMEATGDNIPVNLTRDWYSRTTGQRIDTAYQVRGEMPGEANKAITINNP